MQRIIELTCIECPMGCCIKVVKDDQNNGLEISGNGCLRGKLYATNEVVCPKRVITTTVRCEDGQILPVKTSAPVEKLKTFEYIKVINGLVAKLPVKIGDVLLKDLVPGVNVIATDNREKGR